MPNYLNGSLMFGFVDTSHVTLSFDMSVFTHIHVRFEIKELKYFILNLNFFNIHYLQLRTIKTHLPVKHKTMCQPNRTTNKVKIL